MTHITIPRELQITFGSQTTQRRLRLSVLGETVFDNYEDNLDNAERLVASRIVAAHARLVTKYADTLKPAH